MTDARPAEPVEEAATAALEGRLVVYPTDTVYAISTRPDDARATRRLFEAKARSRDLELPVLKSVMRSNRLQIDRALDEIVQTGRKRVGLLGFSFKAGTDDLRESPMVILAESLLGKGYEVRIYDHNVLVARLTGSNREYIEQQIQHLTRLLCNSIDEVLEGSDVVVIGNAAPEFGDAMVRCRPDQLILDLVRVPCDRAKIVADYNGICW